LSPPVVVAASPFVFDRVLVSTWRLPLLNSLVILNSGVSCSIFVADPTHFNLSINLFKSCHFLAGSDFIDSFFFTAAFDYIGFW
jgi:hypothetical protein